MNKQLWIQRRIVRKDFVPDVSFVPPMQRRRLSLLQKVMFAISQELIGEEKDYTVFFSSRDGEYQLTRRLVHDFRDGGDVSPGRFSTSVYNAAPGLFSVFTQNQQSYSALAAGEETVECGLLEAICEQGPRLWVYAEETGGGYGCGAFLSDGPEGVPVRCTAGDPARTPLTFAAAADFLEGRSRRLAGRYVTLEVAEGNVW